MDTNEKLSALYKSWSGEFPPSVTRLAVSGSNRDYYRICGIKGPVIGAYNDDLRENKAFAYLTRHFGKAGMPVPELLACDPENRIYLIADLGDDTLYQLLVKQRSTNISVGLSAWIDPVSPGSPSGEKSGQSGDFPTEILEIYKKALHWLPKFQVLAAQGLDYSVCYPRAAFDRQSMMWDLNYFKYYFLKLAKIPFDEQALEDDFHGLCDVLLAAKDDFFLFRDFQSRNIMVMGDNPWFIDYQGGRKGALQYDVASLLYDAKADIPEKVRQFLLGHYLDCLEEIYPVGRPQFLESYYPFVLVRILQALGAYGFRGYYEHKAHFLKSIPYALHNLRVLREDSKIGFGLSSLMDVIDRMAASPVFFSQHGNRASGLSGDFKHGPPVNRAITDAGKKLTLSIHSFSYKKTIPPDYSGNGGGFVFDCRALPNPGRYDEYKPLNGRDQPVIDFLKKEPSVDEFLRHTFSLVDQSISVYITRGFNHLMVSYGCTGGQHRSVYCAEALAKYVKKKYEIRVVLYHAEV